MVIISRGRINEYSGQYPDAKVALTQWFMTTSAADWSNINDVRQTFNHVDYVKNNLYVFNIMGNHFRLIVRILFSTRTVFVRYFGTHTDYDTLDISTL